MSFRSRQCFEVRTGDYTVQCQGIRGPGQKLAGTPATTVNLAAKAEQRTSNNRLGRFDAGGGPVPHNSDVRYQGGPEGGLTLGAGINVMLIDVQGGKRRFWRSPLDPQPLRRGESLTLLPNMFFRICVRHRRGSPLSSALCRRNGAWMPPETILTELDRYHPHGCSGAEITIRAMPLLFTCHDLAAGSPSRHDGLPAGGTSASRNANRSVCWPRNASNRIVRAWSAGGGTNALARCRM